MGCGPKPGLYDVWRPPPSLTRSGNEGAIPDSYHPKTGRREPCRFIRDPVGLEALLIAPDILLPSLINIC